MPKPSVFGSCSPLVNNAEWFDNFNRSNLAKFVGNVYEAGDGDYWSFNGVLAGIAMFASYSDKDTSGRALGELYDLLQHAHECHMSNIPTTSFEAKLDQFFLDYSVTFERREEV
jgi:hypothetical protein